MARIVHSRCVLAVRDLQVSTNYYVDVLGFRKDPIDAEGWSFLSRDEFSVMLGECKDEKPASELGNHSYFVYWNVDGVDEFYREITARALWSRRSHRTSPGGSENLHCGPPMDIVLHAGKPSPSADLAVVLHGTKLARSRRRNGATQQ